MTQTHEAQSIPSRINTKKSTETLQNQNLKLKKKKENLLLWELLGKKTQDVRENMNHQGNANENHSAPPSTLKTA